MKTRRLISLLTCILAASACACSGQPSEPTAVAEEPIGTTEQSLVSATGNIMMWPAGPIVWDGLVGTYPISVWSTGAVGAVAFDMVGVTNLGVSVVGFPAIVPMPITTPYLNAFYPTAAGVAAVADPLLGPAGVYAPGYGFAGAYDPFVAGGLAYGYNAFAPGLGTYAVTPGLMPWLTPALTTSAFMFTNLAALNAFTPYTFNVTFTATAAAQTAAIAQSTAIAQSAALANMSLSIFATPIASTALTAAAIPFSSIVYPIMPPLGLGAAAVAAPIVPVAAVPVPLL